MDVLVVTGVIEVAPEDAETFRVAAARAAKATRSDDEGCLLYAFYEDVEKPGTFRVYEEWRDEEALAAHARAPHMDTFRNALSDVEILRREIGKHDGMNPRGLTD
ncbi:putative quinol monooxygenase [Pseudaestuariivita atlantica]|uniref:ABM domain-containing protein n=1 Tax=Pseudaestuariivita atlantica TaxID=1317121 RepID=A0A0L1JMD2_9RHOB|nr:putative quinol monooxygenase [Pseudaestuariivita atlantica]KNG92914.1 hypothetical protein ATO11_15790 [Pseudaestuariivita atlantica]